MADGHKNVCKECCGVYQSAYYEVNQKRISEATNSYRKANLLKSREYGLRYASKNREALKERSKAYRASHREQGGAYRKAYYAANAEVCVARSTDWAKRNREKMAVAAAKWRSVNPEKASASSRANNNRRRSAEGSHSAADILNLYQLQKGKCAICKISVSGGYHVDHVVPLVAGGSNWKENLQILCPPCNRNKHAKDPVAFMQARGFLL